MRVMVMLQIKDRADKKYMLEWISNDGDKCGFVLQDGGKVYVKNDGCISIPRVDYTGYVYKDLILNIDSLELYAIYDIKMEYDSDGLCLWVEYKPSKVKECI